MILEIRSSFSSTGPCGETEAQVLQIARVKDSDVSIFRAEIWKPRTRPAVLKA
jgi:chorismate mutase